MNKNIRRPIPFVIVSSNHGSMIVNRLDYNLVQNNQLGYGVGFQILNTSSHDQAEVDLALRLLECRRKYFGDGVNAIDCGANIGVHTVEWARYMHDWGCVVAFEAQERIYYALAGNIAINNCFNAKAIFAAVGEDSRRIRIPQPNYLRPASFGSLEIKARTNGEFIGQVLDYSEQATTLIEQRTLDSFALPRVDFIKIDVEGMEIEVLEGATATIREHKPLLLVEIIKSDQPRIRAKLTAAGYKVFAMGINDLAVHESDPTISHVKSRGEQTVLTA